MPRQRADFSGGQGPTWGDTTRAHLDQLQARDTGFAQAANPPPPTVTPQAAPPVSTAPAGAMQDWAAPGHDKGSTNIGWQMWAPGEMQRLGTGLEGQQQQAVDLTRAAALGEAPSVAQQQLQAGATDMQSRLRQALASSAASNRGMGFGARQAAANLAAAQGAGQMGAQVASQAAQLRAQEMAQGRQALAQQLGAMRGQDIQGLGLGQAQNELMALQNRAALEASTSQADINQRTRQAEIEAASQGISGALGTLGGIFGGVAMSDERVKKNVKDAGDNKMRSLLGALKAKAYDYKRQDDGGDGQLGILAQDLERSDLGKTIVREVDHPDGRRKAIDLTRALSAALASAAHLHGRVAALEGE